MKSTPAIELHTVSEDLAIGEPSISKLLGKDGRILNFVLLFNCHIPMDFSIGLCDLRWKKAVEWTGDLAEHADLIRISEGDAPLFRPPFAPGTRMVLAVRRPADQPDELQFCFKRKDHQSGVYSLKTRSGRDFLALRCSSSVMITSDLIKLLTPAQYAMVCREERDGRCVRCFDRKAEVKVGDCGHVVYCSQCDPKTTECPVCYARSLGGRMPRFLEH